MLTTLTCGVQQRPKNIQRVMVNGFSGAVDAPMKDLGEDINTAHCKHPVVIFSFPSFINWERGVTTQRWTTSPAVFQMLLLSLTCDGVPVIGTVPGVFMRIPHPKPLARFLGRRPSLHPARPQPPHR